MGEDEAALSGKEGDPARHNDYLSKPYYGSPEPAALGRICHSRSAAGIVSSRVYATGWRLIPGNGCSMPSQMIPTLNTLWSRPPSSRSTATDRAQKWTQSQAIDHSEGGMTTKIMAFTDAICNLVRFVLLAGQRFQTVGVSPLIEGLAFDAPIAGKAFDRNAIIAELGARGAEVVISQHPRPAEPLADEGMYKKEHLIENLLGKLKKFKRVAMGFDKTDQSFASMIHLAATLINSR